jgi:hypothetical protein
VETRVTAFLDEVAAWAGEQPDVHGVVLLGSQARTDSPADEASDVDLSLFATLEDDVVGRFGLAVSVDREEVLRRLDALLV